MILWNTITIFVANSEVVLSVCISLFSRLAIPLYCFNIILGNTITLAIRELFATGNLGDDVRQLFPVLRLQPDAMIIVLFVGCDSVDPAVAEPKAMVKK